jgi:hypothetical protein
LQQALQNEIYLSFAFQHNKNLCFIIFKTQNTVNTLIVIFGGNFCTISFIKVFLKSYPIHKPAAVDYIMFKFCEFLSISNFVWRAFIKESTHLCCKKVGIESHKEINILV